MKSRFAVALAIMAAITLAVAFAGSRRQPALTPVEATPATPALDLPAPAGPAFEIGPPAAAILLEEYSDYECPYCARAYLATGAEIAAFVERRGDIRYSFYDLGPPPHFRALAAATAARCAGAQGNYPAAQRLLFERQREWAARDSQTAGPVELVAALVLDRSAYDRCTAAQDSIAEILDANLERALGKGVQATPTLILTVAGRPTALRGAVDSARIAAILERN